MERGNKSLNYSRWLKERLEYVRCTEADEGSLIHSGVLFLFYSS
nr:MAG TPA: hypothetical protein [Caudoviricetes sp.]